MPETPFGYASNPIPFRVDAEVHQILIVCGSPLKQPVDGALWLFHNEGPDEILVFDDHKRTQTIARGRSAIFKQAPEVNVALRVLGSSSQATTGSIQLLKPQKWEDARAGDILLRGDPLVSCAALDGMEGSGHWAVNYSEGTLPMDILAAHPSGPGGQTVDNTSYALTALHDQFERTIIVYKPHGKELSVHIDTDAIGRRGEMGADNYVKGSYCAL